MIVEGELSIEERPELLPSLTVAGGPIRGLSFRLDREPQVIGRAPAAEISVNDPHLSRRHAEVRLTGEGVSLVDLGSTNGTWVNDRRVTGMAYLADGDVIRVGRTEFRFFDPGVARTDPVGLQIGAAHRNQRPTLPLPIAAPAAPPAFPGGDPQPIPADASARP